MKVKIKMCNFIYFPHDCSTLSKFFKKYSIIYTVEPVLRGHSKIDEITVLKTSGNLMKIESIAICALLEHSAILLICIKG